MPFDALSIAKLIPELNEELSNGRINKIYQPDAETFIFEVFHPFPRRELLLLISVHPRFFRAHLVEEKPVNPLRPPAFCMLLRKYLQGGRILRVEQPPWERILIFTIEVYEEDLGLTNFSLIFEALGRSSNLLLVNGEGNIIDVLKRRPDSPPHSREIIPGKPYSLPPAPGLPNPETLTFSAWKRICQFSPAARGIATVLTKEVFGLSRLLAEEILTRAGVPSTLTVADLTSDQLRELYYQISTLGQAGGEKSAAFIALDPAGVPLDFFPYQPRHLPAERITPAPNLNSAIVASLHRQSQLALARQKVERLQAVLRKAAQKAIKKRDKQRQELAGAEIADTYRLYGELIAVHLGEIKRGQTRLVVPNYYDPEGTSVTIPLDPALSPVANSQLYYKKYNKAKKGQAKIREQLERTEMELDYYASLENALANLSSPADLMEIETEMVEAGLLKTISRSKPTAGGETKNRPSLFRAGNGWEIMVGRNNKQNDQLSMRTAAPHDLWLHTQKIPGSHVIIRTQGKPVPPSVLLAAANLAVYFSKARGSTKVPVDYTERRHLRKPTGAPPGFVLYDHYQTLIIDPDPLILARFGLNER
ncbi:MAG: fibronectin-binding domain-containing protein [Firmicutes bacterium]|nr:fibronectin-binding domain-containing protein [Bacillota bacterium]